ncbi:MAG: S9 family peptidase [Firmicutes bacterium]|nr:S9 family peptidase [Bacillota bacterium]
MEKLKLDDFTRYHFLSGIEFSPDGEHVCFAAHRANLDKNNYDSNLWIYNVKTDRYFQLTAFDQERGFIWLDDGEHILFPGIRKSQDKDKQAGGEVLTVFYKISIHGGEAREAFRLPLPVKSIRQVDSTRFLVTATYNPNRPDLDGMSEADKAAELKRRKEEKDYEVVEEIPFWSNGEGFVSKNRNRVYLYDSASRQYEALTNDKLQVYSLQLNEARTKAVLIGQEYTGRMERQNTLYILDIDEKSLRRLTPEDEKITYNAAQFIREDKLICLANEMERHGINENARFHIVDVKSGQRQLLTPDFEQSTWNSVGSDCRFGGGQPVRVDNGYLYFMTTEDFSSYINRIDIDGKIERITSATGSVDSYAIHDGEILFIALRGLKLQELYRFTGSDEEQITRFNDWVASEKSLSEPKHFSFESSPGVMIDGWVMEPVDKEEGRKYPAILNIHGGPKTVYGDVFYHEMQYWANAGYYVFFCNPRGGDGKGNEFADIRGKYGTIDYDDIMRFTDEVLKRYPDIDAERLGVTGGSYGGFMTNWIIGHTDRFRAAASQRSISNWVSFGFVSDIGYFFEPDQVGATPWEDIDKVWEHSPLKYADKVKTPTLFIHSDEDYRCWVPEAIQMFTALKFHGVESRLCMFRGENHELSRSGKPKPRIRRLEEITQWFDRYLME